AADSVWVSPGMLETKLIVAPNSPIALAKERIMPGGDAGALRLTLVAVVISMAALLAAEFRARLAGRRIDPEGR
ncbi:hypothetical protein AB9F45_37130, partial [Rhizobium leguminosarum]